MSLATDIAANAPLTIAAAKAAIREAARPLHSHDLARIEAMIEACFRSEDYQEGQRAFAEKRPPVFSGR
jgi:enoyl-CoA hydratase/carnithine racemase